MSERVICASNQKDSVLLSRTIIYNTVKHNNKNSVFVCVYQFNSVQLLSHAQLFATAWTAVHQASLSISNSRSLLKLMSIESVIPSNHLILCHPLLLPPTNFPSIRVFSNESVLPIKWPKYWSYSFTISPSNEYSGLISLKSKGLSRVFSNTTVQDSSCVLLPAQHFT